MSQLALCFASYASCYLLLNALVTTCDTLVTSSFLLLVVMASTLVAMASNLIASLCLVAMPMPLFSWTGSWQALASCKFGFGVVSASLVAFR